MATLCQPRGASAGRCTLVLESTQLMTIWQQTETFLCTCSEHRPAVQGRRSHNGTRTIDCLLVLVQHFHLGSTSM